jgi:hypothetical protein
MKIAIVDNGTVLMSIGSIPPDRYAAGSDGYVYYKNKAAEWCKLSSHDSGHGYLAATFCLNGKKRSKTIHVLINTAFHGPAPRGLQTRHLDGNKKNNRPGNLTWGTPYENYLDKIRHGTICAGDRHPRSKLTEVEHDHVRWAISHGLCSGKHAARVLGYSRGSMGHFIHPERYVSWMKNGDQL